MAESIAFHFFPGDSVIHRLDIRFKLAILILLNIFSLNAGTMGLTVLSLMLFTGFVHAKLPIKSALMEIRYFSVLLLFVFVARVLSIPGEVIFEQWFVRISWQGIQSGAMVCYQLFVIAMVSIIFVFTSKPMEIKDSIEWFLRPVPFVPEKSVAIMISLMIRFIPLILEQSKEISDAQNARCIQNRRNPIVKIASLCTTIMRKTFESADDLAYAMEARCFSEERTKPEFSAKRADWFMLGFILLTGAFILIF